MGPHRRRRRDGRCGRRAREALGKTTVWSKLAHRQAGRQANQRGGVWTRMVYEWSAGTDRRRDSLREDRLVRAAAPPLHPNPRLAPTHSSGHT
eukprot:255787-Chlamydomonas_euryale.AAC.1